MERSAVWSRPVGSSVTLLLVSAFNGRGWPVCKAEVRKTVRGAGRQCDINVTAHNFPRANVTTAQCCAGRVPAVGDDYPHRKVIIQGMFAYGHFATIVVEASANLCTNSVV
jgi:hypothetical protein